MIRSHFNQSRPILGMLHIGALPGTPRYADPLKLVIARAVEEARTLANAGLDGLIIENMHDLPYLNGRVGPEIVAGMTAVGVAVRAATSLPFGVQILAAANQDALAVAQSVGAAFIRAENFVYAHVADEGLMPTAAAGPLLRYRRQIAAGEVRIVADIKKKHAAHSLTSDVSLADTARAAELCGADAVIVTGVATGEPTAPADVAAVKSAVRIPVWVGSGTTAENLPALWPHADGFIVGSAFKCDGVWSNALDSGRIERFMTVVRSLRA